MASSSTRSDKSDKQSIHVLDFLYPPGETSENILSSITNELIRHFGNTVYVNENLKNSPKEPLEPITKPPNEDGKQRIVNKPKNNLTTHHKLFDLSDYREKVVDIAVNKKYLCILFDDGSVHRATCNVPTYLKDDSYNQSKVKVESSGKLEPLQVASDESFARDLYHSINNMGSLPSTLSARSSYGISSQVPSRPNVVINNIPGYNAGIFSQSDYGESNVNLPVQRVLSRNYSRYVPYSPNLSQARQRRIHWSHLVNVPSPGSIIYPPNNEELTQDSMEIQDESQMDLMNNITIVSVDSDVPSEFRMTGLQTTSSQPDMNFPLPNTGIVTPTMEQVASPVRQDQRTSDTGFLHSPLLVSSQPMISGDAAKQGRDMAGPSNTSNFSPKKNLPKREGSSNASDTPQGFAGSLKREPPWSSALGNLKECGLMVLLLESFHSFFICFICL